MIIVRMRGSFSTIRSVIRSWRNAVSSLNINFEVRFITGINIIHSLWLLAGMISNDKNQKFLQNRTSGDADKSFMKRLYYAMCPCIAAALRF